jgi:hypothetical protein
VATRAEAAGATAPSEHHLVVPQDDELRMPQVADVEATQECECAGINRHVVGDERALQKRSIDSILTLSLAWYVARRTAKRR